MAKASRMIANDDGNQDKILTINFSKYPELYDQLKEESDSEVRSMEMQVIYHLKKLKKEEDSIKIETAECCECGDSFMITRKGRKYCSDKCRRENAKRTKKNTAAETDQNRVSGSTIERRSSGAGAEGVRIME